MNEALVENSEHHVGGKDRRQDQHALAFERVLKHLRRTLEAGADRDRQTEFALDFLDRVDRLPERKAGREIKRDRHGGLIALVINLQRADRGHDAGDR